MPWRRGWPPYVSQRLLDDRRRADADLDQASDDLKDTIRRAVRTERIAGKLVRAREVNHFSESMELLFTSGTTRTRTAHHPKDVL